VIACVSIPYFAAAVERRADETLADKPLAIGGQPWEARPVYAFSHEVACRGVKSGMSLRLVQILSPHSHFIPAAKVKYSQVSSEVMDVLTDFSCLVEPQELWHSAANPKQYFTKNGRTLPARYCLDLEGLPAGESIPFVKEMGKTLRRETALTPAIGLAANKFTAQVAATLSRSNHALPVASGHGAQFLSSRAVDFLPLDKETSRRLRLLGIRTLGQLAGLPAPSVRTQFGPDMEPFYRLAQGEDGEPVKAYPIERREQVSRQFDGPVVNVQVIAAALHHISVELAHRLQAAGWQGSELDLHMEMDDGNKQKQSLLLRYPTANARHLSTALDELSAQASFNCGVTGLSVTLTGLRPATVQQLGLFNEGEQSDLAHLTIQNMTAKYKTSHFYGPVLTERDHPLPERRFRLQTFAPVNARPTGYSIV
jgi:DNA polymerase-4